MTKSRINIVTLGCSKNKVDSEHLAAMLSAEDVEVVHDANVITPVVIINTCGFIGDAKEESIETILSFAGERKKGKIRKLVVMGCLSQRYRKELTDEIHEVDGFFGVDELTKVAEAVLAVKQEELPYYGKRMLSTPAHYAYLKISEGCDRSCSFCAIPLIRGKHQSFPANELLQEASMLAKQGVKELILIAQDLTYYGSDQKNKGGITELVRQLAEINGIEWVRLQYAYPTSFPDDLLDLMLRQPKICRYIDLPLQHVNTRILKSMKRGITHEETVALVKKIRTKIPDVAFRTTFIVGYPGETEQEFEELMQFVREMRFERVGVFTYSPEEDTAAYDLDDDVPEEVKTERMEKLMELQQQISYQNNQQRIGKQESILIDRIEGDFFVGRSQFDSPEVDNEVLVARDSHQLKIGQFYPCVITDADDYDCFASLV